MYKELKLSNGDTVKVFTPPLTRIYSLVGKKYPEPKAPVRSDKTVTGKEISMVIEDDPEYLEAYAQWEEDYNQGVDEAMLVFALKEEWPPKDFDFSGFEEEILYFDPDWKPKTDRVGKKIDWLQWERLANPQDYTNVQLMIQELLGIDQEATDQTETSFPGDVAGEASGRVDEEVKGES